VNFLRDNLLTYWREARKAGQMGAPKPGVRVLFRQLRPWLRSLQAGVTPMSMGLPWTTFTAIEHLQTHLRSGMKVFEFGSGGSTLFFIRQGAVVSSVEHEKIWHERVVRELASLKISGHDVRFVPPEPALETQPGDPSDPEVYATSDEVWRKYSFRNYAACIDAHAPETFDVILVDGRARPACVRHALPRLKPGGLLVLDNSERAEYARAMALVDQMKWPRTDCIGPGPCNRYFWRTTIWQKPEKDLPRAT
jgi:hypothetical protein